MNEPATLHSPGFGWQHVLFLFIVIGSLVFMLSIQPIGQDPAYHEFADRRAFFGISNFFDVISNIPFLFVGIAGMRLCRATSLMSLRSVWLAFFAGMAFVCAGSVYYHWNPNNGTLVWGTPLRGLPGLSTWPLDVIRASHGMPQ